MKRYLVKLTCTATENNNNFPNVVHTYYYGKRFQSTENPNHINFMAKYCGYTTKASATSGLKTHQRMAEWETAKGFWKDTCELIEVEIAE